MPLSTDSIQLAEPISSVPQAFCQLSFGALPAKQWKCVCLLWLAQSKGEPVSLENTDQLLRPAQCGSRAFGCSPPPHSTLPTSAARPRHSCPVPLPLLPCTNARAAGGE